MDDHRGISVQLTCCAYVRAPCRGTARTWPYQPETVKKSSRGRRHPPSTVRIACSRHGKLYARHSARTIAAVTRIGSLVEEHEDPALDALARGRIGRGIRILEGRMQRMACGAVPERVRSEEHTFELQ